MEGQNLSDQKTGLRSKLTSYGDDEFSLFLRKAFIKGAGYNDDALARPIIGLIDTSSGFNPCHGNVPALLTAAERSILLAGALPVRFPTISLHESFASPTSMYLRNLMSIDTEEMVKAQPMDGVVLIGGCDKTVPAQLMGAISANVPCISLVTGPMLTGSYEGKRVGACTDCRSYWKDYRAGVVDIEDIVRVNDELVPSVGYGIDMRSYGRKGTASTMACILEALGIAPLGSATPTAPSSARLRVASQIGSLIVSNSLASETPLRPQDVLTRKSFENAITALQAIGGSTNAIVHLLAIAGRVPGLGPTEAGGITLDDFDRIGKRTPLLVDLKPSGEGYMEDFHRAGGIPALLSVLAKGGLLHLDARTVEAPTLGAALAAHPAAQRHGTFAQNIIRSLSDPLYPGSSLVVLRGNLAPDGCVLKASAASPNLLKHRGPAIVFSSAADLAARVDSADLSVTPETVLVMQGTGPVGHPGMPEAGLIPIPKKLATQGVKDMLRVSDARMSGTAQGTVVLHVAPESAKGGPLALVRDGDVVGINMEEGKIWVEITDEEMKRRRKEWEENHTNGRKRTKRGYAGLYERTVQQANLGADFDWLTAS
ncbi:dihydroxy-acid and 6-phosphogluconate dehydratase [Sanghuangporus baumii]|uniref:dihydroxy-acid dehydratase n=1 Tax=Sanghuangporus baumii TaxID=108892 RepID=A0A9Q5I1X9_SANBA|nr:dihydroxy-acid and 6-phosphogluconate dehydratase [Sanghuangporus baumii]